jgi:hypothetical protein
VSADERHGSIDETRLDELRGEAERTGRVTEPGVRAVGGPVPQAAGQEGYYGRPVIKPSVWTWEIPVYFFVGGLAGGSAILAWAAHVAGAPPGLTRAALWMALVGTLVSAALLILDLGRPIRFLYMLRVFKWRSPMSVGVWVLTAFGGVVTLALAGMELGWHDVGPELLASVLLNVGVWSAAPLGGLVATYTGVLIGATVVPAWNLHRGTLPLHFGVAGLGSAAASLELMGFQVPALWAIGLLAAGMETLVSLSVELLRHGESDRALREGRPGVLLRLTGLLAGPASAGLRLLGLTSAAATSFLLGAFLSRFGWMEAGQASASDPAAALERYSR